MSLDGSSERIADQSRLMHIHTLSHNQLQVMPGKALDHVVGLQDGLRFGHNRAVDSGSRGRKNAVWG